MLLLVGQTGSQRTIAVVSKQHALLFSTVTNHPSSCSMNLIPRDQIPAGKFKKLINGKVHGVVGLIEVDGSIFIGVITEAHRVAQPVPGETVNKISCVEFFCLSTNKWDFVELDSQGYAIIPGADDNEKGEKHPCQDLRKLLSNGSFYYSSDFDLTSLLQNRGMAKHSLGYDHFEEEFMWNSFLTEEVVTFRDTADDKTKEILDDEGFLTTVIRGFAETFQTSINDQPCTLTIISKQSWKRAGTRFNARGIDDESHVANFVETETIMYSDEYCYAFTEVRGSVPIFWEQDTSLINAKVTVTRSLEATQPVFDKHFVNLVAKYGPVHIVNLLSTKTNEIELSRRYKQHSAKCRENIQLTEFDFHKETAQNGFSAANKIMPFIKESLLTSGYYSFDVRTGQALSAQDGVFRTNCLDCLDRTNLIQQFFSKWALQLFMQDHKLRSNEDLFEKHSSLWADHGDQISQIYTGTNAMKSSFSRSGKMTLAGALSDATKSVSRMYINNFQDKGKQMVIDTLLGRLGQKPVSLYDPANDHVRQKLPEYKSQFTTQSQVNVFCGTYNVNALTKEVDLTNWLFPIGDKFKPDVVVLGLQEVIELSAGSILSADYSRAGWWEKLVAQVLNKYDNYVMLRCEQMSSLMMLFFVKADQVNNVKHVEGAVKKTGLGGITGNKGAVAIRFDFGNTPFCFVNAHLAAGTDKVEERVNDYNSINQLKFNRNKTILDHENIWWLGDLNFRLNLTNAEVRSQLAQECNANVLLEFDQLTMAIQRGLCFEGFKEPSIRFRPTYKYDKGTDNYDSSEKERTPSWTDRIIYKGDVRPLAYSDAPLKYSDHKPVYAAYKATVEFVDEAKKQVIKRNLYEEVKSTSSTSLSSLVHQDINLIDDLVTSTSHVSLVPNKRSPTPSENLFAQPSAVASPVRQIAPSRVTSPTSINAPVMSPNPRNLGTMNRGSSGSPALSASPALTPSAASPVRTPASIVTPASTTPASTATPPAPPPPRKVPPGFSDSVLTPAKRT